MEFVSFRLQVLMEHQLEKQVEVFTLMFSLTTGIIKKLLSIAKKKKKRHDKILMLAKSQLDSTNIPSTD